MAGTIPVTVLLEILAAKDAEIEKLKKEKNELTEKLRRSELEKENSARSGGQIEEIPGRNLDDDPAPAPSAKRNRSDPASQLVINELKGMIESVQKEAQKAINDLRKQYAGINNRVKITMTPVNESKPGFTILLIGGMKNIQEDADPFVLSSDRSKWIEVELNLPYRINSSGVVYYNEELYLIGGWNNFKSLYKLDKNLKWIRLADMNIGRYAIRNSCLAYNGSIWVFGGWDEKNNLVRSIERYHVKENKWTIIQDMKHARESVPVILWKDRIVLAGSDVGNASSKKTATAELLNPEDGTWTMLPNLPKFRQANSAISYKERIIIMGGHDGKASCNNVWELDPHQPNPTWSALPPMKIPSNWLGGTVLDGKIYAIGGRYKSKDLDRVEVFDGEKWQDGPSLPYPQRSMSAVIIPQHFADRLCANKP